MRLDARQYDHFRALACISVRLAPSHRTSGGETSRAWSYDGFVSRQTDTGLVQVGGDRLWSEQQLGRYLSLLVMKVHAATGCAGFSDFD